MGVYCVVEGAFFGHWWTSLLLLFEGGPILSLLFKILKSAWCDWTSPELVLLSLEAATALKLNCLHRIELRSLRVFGLVHVVVEPHRLVFVVGRVSLPGQVLHVDRQVLLRVWLHVGIAVLL